MWLVFVLRLFVRLCGLVFLCVWLCLGVLGCAWVFGCVWVIWLQTIQGGPAALLLFVLIGFVLLAILCRQKIGILLAGAVLFTGLAFLPAPAALAPYANGLDWQVWLDVAIAAARPEGQLAFGAVTAHRCTTR